MVWVAAYVPCGDLSLMSQMVRKVLDVTARLGPLLAVFDEGGQRRGPGPFTLEMQEWRGSPLKWMSHRFSKVRGVGLNHPAQMRLAQLSEGRPVAAAESITVEALARALRVAPESILQECRLNGLNASTPRSLLRPNERDLVEHWFGRGRPAAPRAKGAAGRDLTVKGKVNASQAKGGSKGSDWTRLVRARDSGSTLSGPVVEVVKGGLIVDLGARAFLPASLVDSRPVADLAALIGQVLEVHVVEAEASKRNLIVSRRSVLERRSERAAATFFASVEPGELRQAIVRATRLNGIIVEVDGVEVFVKEQQLASAPSSHTLGGLVDVAVCDVDRENRSVVLSTRLERERMDPSTKDLPPDGLLPDDPDAGIVGVGEVLLVDMTYFDELALGSTLVEASRLGHRQVTLVLDGGPGSGKVEMRKAILSGRFPNVDRDRCRQTPDGFLVALRADQE